MLNIYFLFHLICIVYCLWRINKRYKKVSLDGIIGVTPGLDTVIVILIAPVLAVLDIIITWVKIIKNRNQ